MRFSDCSAVRPFSENCREMSEVKVFLRESSDSERMKASHTPLQRAMVFKRFGSCRLRCLQNIFRTKNSQVFKLSSLFSLFGFLILNKCVFLQPCVGIFLVLCLHDPCTSFPIGWITSVKDVCSKCNSFHGKKLSL